MLTLLRISDSVPKILGGFVDYFSSNTQTYYGRRFEWPGAFDYDNQLEIWNVYLSEGYCNLDEGGGYCGLYLIVTSNTTSNETGYDIRGGRYVDNSDGSVVMSWGVDSTAPGFADTVVATWVRFGVASADLHFMIQPIDGAFQFIDFCQYKCTPDETVTSLGMLEIAHFRCWAHTVGMAVNDCKLFIWD